MTYTEPLILLVCAVLIAGLIRAQRGRGAGLAWAGIAAFLLLSWPPLEWLLSRPLEGRYPALAVPKDDSAEAIVVLSSTVNAPAFGRPYYVLGQDTFERCEYAAWLHKTWRRVPVLAGGSGDVRFAPPFSPAMREYLVRAGVPAEMIWTEDLSSNTHENALHGAEILRRHGIRKVALVVDALSMLRASACFRKEGIEVIPAPSSFRQFGPLTRELIPSWKAIRRNEANLHETLGLAWYRLRGWI